MVLFTNVVESFRKNSFYFYSFIVAVFVIAKIIIGLPYAIKDGKRDTKMPAGMKWVNVGFIVLFFIFTCIMIWSYRGRGRGTVIMLVLIAGMILGVLVIEATGKKTLGLVKPGDHMSYGPAITMLLYVCANIFVHSLIDSIGMGTESFVMALTAGALGLYFGATRLNSFGVAGDKIVEINNARDLKVGDYARKFTAYSSISMGDVAVVEIAIPLIVAVYLFQNFVAQVGGSVEKHNAHILGVLVLGLFCAGLSRFIANIIKLLVVKPRPCAARIAGCNLANNKVSCKGCKTCKGNVDAVNCNKSCYYSDVEEKTLTANCMCKGNWNDFGKEEDDLVCENMWNRKMELYAVGDYTDDSQKKALAQAFQSMPSGHTLSACFVAFFVILVYIVCDNYFKFDKTYLLLMAAVSIYAGLVGYSRVADGWHWPVDCVAGAGVSVITLVIVFVFGYRSIDKMLNNAMGGSVLAGL